MITNYLLQSHAAQAQDALSMAVDRIDRDMALVRADTIRGVIFNLQEAFLEREKAEIFRRATIKALGVNAAFAAAVNDLEVVDG